MIFYVGEVGLPRYELGKGVGGGAGATDEDETNSRSMTIMNKVGPIIDCIRFVESQIICTMVWQKN